MTMLLPIDPGVALPQMRPPADPAPEGDSFGTTLASAAGETASVTQGRSRGPDRQDAPPAPGDRDDPGADRTRATDGRRPGRRGRLHGDDRNAGDEPAGAGDPVATATPPGDGSAAAVTTPVPPIAGRDAGSGPECEAGTAGAAGSILTIASIGAATRGATAPGTSAPAMSPGAGSGLSTAGSAQSATRAASSADGAASTTSSQASVTAIPVMPATAPPATTPPAEQAPRLAASDPAARALSPGGRRGGATTAPAAPAPAVPAGDGTITAERAFGEVLAATAPAQPAGPEGVAAIAGAAQPVQPSQPRATARAVDEAAGHPDGDRRTGPDGHAAASAATRRIGAAAATGATGATPAPGAARGDADTAVPVSGATARAGTGTKAQADGPVSTRPVLRPVSATGGDAAADHGADSEQRGTMGSPSSWDIAASAAASLARGRSTQDAAPVGLHAATSPEMATAADETVARIVERLATLGGRLVPGLEARLHHPELGDVRITVAGRAGDVLQAQIVARDDQAAAALSRSVDRYHQAGGDLTGISLHVRAETGGNAADAGGRWTGDGTRDAEQQRTWRQADPPPPAVPRERIARQVLGGYLDIRA